MCASSKVSPDDGTHKRLAMANRVRKFFVELVMNCWFDRTILLLILVNSVIMALTDYSNINNNYEPVPEGSWRNALGANTEVFFAVAFTFEIVAKIIAMGFNTYLHDLWNILDFIVVLSGWASFIPGLPNVSVFRTFRVLRLFKSVSGLEGVKMVIVAVTNSIPKLMLVIVFLMFVFAIFGIMGMQLFVGLSHGRCRLTPNPVATDWVVGNDPALHVCPVEGKDWSKAGSVWLEKPTACYWPVDPTDERLCSFENGGGMHQCHHGKFFREHVEVFNPGKAEAWCGSNWDVLGNGRFKSTGEPLDIYGVDHTAFGKVYGDAELKWSANYAGGMKFMFGLIDFDNFARAFLTIFQTITLEGWTGIMYMLMDVFDPMLTGMFFVVLVSFGSFFVLQLPLAVLENNYNEEEQKLTDRKLAEKAELEASADAKGALISNQA